MCVEETLRKSGQSDIEAQEVGMAILAPLKELDAVAYLRFASVYRNFSSLADFESEISLLREFPSVENVEDKAIPPLKSNNALAK
jgi:transcriptional repressor NrdR